MSNLQKALDYAHQNHNRFLEDLVEVLKIPSISTDAIYNQEVLRAAEWMAESPQRTRYCKRGNHAHRWWSPGRLWRLIHKPGAPTVLVYGHYDVQPVDPIELWESGPFEPQVRGDLLYARGSSDMKGQALATFHAIEALMEAAESCRSM